MGMNPISIKVDGSFQKKFITFSFRSCNVLTYRHIYFDNKSISVFEISLNVLNKLNFEIAPSRIISKGKVIVQ